MTRQHNSISNIWSVLKLLVRLFSGLFVKGDAFVYLSSVRVFFFFLSHAVWAAAGPSGHHTADDQQCTEGQQHTAHTGLLFCI